MLTVVLIFTTLFVCTWLWWGTNTNKDEPRAFPGALPLIGHAHLLIGDSIKFWNLLKEGFYDSLKAGGVISISIGPRELYVVTDPNDCLNIGNTCLQKDKYYEFGKPWLGEGLLTADLPIWKAHRKLLSPAFNQVVLDGFIDVFNAQSRCLVKDLEVEVAKGPFDHWVYTRHNALETICLTALGVDFTDKSVLNSEYVEAAEHMLNILIDRAKRFWLYNHFIYSWTSSKRKQDNYIKILHNMSKTVLKQRKATYLNNNKGKEIEEPTRGPKFKPFMDILLEQAIENGAFNDREIREEVDTIIITGHDTSALVLMYTMLLIGSYPIVQEKILEELHGIFGDDDRDVTKQDLSRLIYLEAVLKESMRFYPILPLIARNLDRDMKLRNCTLSKGKTCVLSIYGVHRHSIWGPDAEEFRPERWLDPTTLPENATTFASFGFGRRNCIGKSYAYMSMKTTLAHVCRNYKISSDHKKLVAKYSVLLRPVSGYHIEIERRKKLP